MSQWSNSNWIAYEIETRKCVKEKEKLEINLVIVILTVHFNLIQLFCLCDEIIETMEWKCTLFYVYGPEKKK